LDNTEHFKLYEYLENLFDDKLNMMFTSQPATIISFNAEDNTVTAKLDKEGLEFEDIPISLFGNPTSYITTPTLENGTKGLLLFSKHDLQIWVGEGKDELAKTDFSKNNAFFLIGATNALNKINYNLNAIEIKTDKAIEQIANKHISLTAPKIHLTDSDSSEELFDLLGQTLDLMQSLASELVATRTSIDNESLTSSPAFSSLSSQFATLSSKYKGFK